MNALPALFIIGSSRLQNELLGSFLSAQLGLPCHSLPRLEDLPPATPGSHRILLLDAAGQDDAAIARRLEREAPAGTEADLWGLFNLGPRTRIEERAFCRGARAFFYADDPPERVARGIRALLGGELWISRRAMEQMLLSARPLLPRLGPTAAELTARERDILHLVTTGASNERIGTALAISPHTVKTHVYNIFKKIGVSNRMEAALWATRQGEGERPAAGAVAPVPTASE